MQLMWGLIRGFQGCRSSVGSEKSPANEKSRVPAWARGRSKAGILRRSRVDIVGDAPVFAIVGCSMMFSDPHSARRLHLFSL